MMCRRQRPPRFLGGTLSTIHPSIHPHKARLMASIMYYDIYEADYSAVVVVYTTGKQAKKGK